MPTEENMDLARRFLEARGRADLDAMEEMMAPDFVDHTLSPGQEPDREGYKRQVAEYVTAFSSVRLATEDQIAAGDKLFYSDGLVEAHNPHGEMFGFPKLRRLVAEHGEERRLVEFLARMEVLEGWRFWANVHAVVDDLASGNAEILLLEIGALDSRRLSLCAAHLTLRGLVVADTGGERRADRARRPRSPVNAVS